MSINFIYKLLSPERKCVDRAELDGEAEEGDTYKKSTTATDIDEKLFNVSQAYEHIHG